MECISFHGNGTTPLLNEHEWKLFCDKTQATNYINSLTLIDNGSNNETYCDVRMLNLSPIQHQLLDAPMVLFAFGDLVICTMTFIWCECFFDVGRMMYLLVMCSWVGIVLLKVDIIKTCMYDIILKNIPSEILSHYEWCIELFAAFRINVLRLEEVVKKKNVHDQHPNNWEPWSIAMIHEMIITFKL